MPIIITNPQARQVAFVLESDAFPPLPGAVNSVEPTAISTTTSQSWADVLPYGVTPGNERS
jgi:hypothetical protein